MMRGIECVADQYGIRRIGIERAVGFVNQRVIGQYSAALQRQWLREVQGLRGDNANGFHLEPKIKKPESIWLVGLNSLGRFELALAVFVRERPLRPQAKVKSAHERKDNEVGAQRQTQ
jgi:hypothetical protein